MGLIRGTVSSSWSEAWPQTSSAWASRHLAQQEITRCSDLNHDMSMSRRQCRPLGLWTARKVGPTPTLILHEQSADFPPPQSFTQSLSLAKGARAHIFGRHGGSCLAWGVRLLHKVLYIIRHPHPTSYPPPLASSTRLPCPKLIFPTTNIAESLRPLQPDAL